MIFRDFSLWVLFSDVTAEVVKLALGQLPLLLSGMKVVSALDRDVNRERKADAVFHRCTLVLPHLLWLGGFAEILVWLRVPVVISFGVATNEVSLSLWKIVAGEKMAGLEV